MCISPVGLKHGRWVFRLRPDCEDDDEERLSLRLPRVPQRRIRLDPRLRTAEMHTYQVASVEPAT